MGVPNPNQMIVEGYEDLHAVVGLMEHHVFWPDDKTARPVEIAIGKSVDEILNKAYISSKLKQSGLQRLGIMLDADVDASGRWKSLRTLLQQQFPNLPEDLPTEGVISSNDGGIKIGVWIMPDNQSVGMLETFLKVLVPVEGKPLWEFAVECTAKAKQYGASYIDRHTDKAGVHAWLAWHNPPGEKFGLAITKKILDPKSKAAEPFVNWFSKLFELQRTTTS